MTDLKQLEQNTSGLNEHGSYCECIWCVEEKIQAAGRVQPEVEQAMTDMLKDLPLSIAISKLDASSSEEYTWQCMGASGKADSFVAATRQALQFLSAAFTVAQV